MPPSWAEVGHRHPGGQSLGRLDADRQLLGREQVRSKRVARSPDDASHPDDASDMLDETRLQTHRQGDVCERAEREEGDLTRRRHHPATELVGGIRAGSPDSERSWQPA